MIAPDTNVLARLYCDDPDDPEAARQRPIARRIVLESPALHVPLAVVLELEWVMRGFYRLEPASFCDAVEHLLGMPHVTVERWEAVKDAVDLHRRGLDFADALHWACSRGRERFVTIDDRLVRRARRLGMAPAIVLAR
jgi:predicted nucleic-acid-binding protein